MGLLVIVDMSTQELLLLLRRALGATRPAHRPLLATRGAYDTLLFGGASRVERDADALDAAWEQDCATLGGGGGGDGEGADTELDAATRRERARVAACDSVVFTLALALRQGSGGGAQRDGGQHDRALALELLVDEWLFSGGAAVTEGARPGGSAAAAHSPDAGRAAVLSLLLLLAGTGPRGAGAGTATSAGVDALARVVTPALESRVLLPPPASRTAAPGARAPLQPQSHTRSHPPVPAVAGPMERAALRAVSRATEEAPRTRGGWMRQAGADAGADAGAAGGAALPRLRGGVPADSGALRRYTHFAPGAFELDVAAPTDQLAFPRDTAAGDTTTTTTATGAGGGVSATVRSFFRPSAPALAAYARALDAPPTGTASASPAAPRPLAGCAAAGGLGCFGALAARLERNLGAPDPLQRPGRAAVSREAFPPAAEMRAALLRRPRTGPRPNARAGARVHAPPAHGIDAKRGDENVSAAIPAAAAAARGWGWEARRLDDEDGSGAGEPDKAVRRLIAPTRYWISERGVAAFDACVRHSFRYGPRATAGNGDGSGAGSGASTGGGADVQRTRQLWRSVLLAYRGVRSRAFNAATGRASRGAGVEGGLAWLPGCTAAALGHALRDAEEACNLVTRLRRFCTIVLGDTLSENASGPGATGAAGRAPASIGGDVE
eukprot:g273.t1